MQIFRTADFTSGSSLMVRVPSGQWSGFLIRLDGTNDTGDTAAALFGRLRLNRNGQELLNMDVDVLQFMNDVDHGFIESTSTEASTYKQSCYIPASVFPYFEDKNVFHVSDDDNLIIEVTYASGVQTDLASCSIAIGGNYQLGVEKYTAIRLQETPNLPTGTTPEVFRGTNNFIALYFTSTYVTRLLLEVDNGVYMNGDQEELQAISNLLARKEAAYTSICKLDVTQGRTETEALSDELKVTFTVSQAATPRCIPVGMRFDIGRENKSRQFFLAVRADKMRRAAITGKPIPVPTIPQPIPPAPVPIPEPTPRMA